MDPPLPPTHTHILHFFSLKKGYTQVFLYKCSLLHIIMLKTVTYKTLNFTVKTVNIVVSQGEKQLFL